MKRSSGLLLHPVSLPSKHGIGNLGGEAHRFIDFLNTAGQSFWQFLPLGPTGYGNSPYNALSAFAGNPLLIDLDLLVEVGDLNHADLNGLPLTTDAIDYTATHSFKTKLLAKAASTFKTKQVKGDRRDKFDQFCKTEKGWLADYCLFMSLRDHFDQRAWNAWPKLIKRRDSAALASSRNELSASLHRYSYEQFIFFEQWSNLKTYANVNGIQLFGDLPIFVAEDSVDVWSHQDLFQLDPNGNPQNRAGVPPDYFSETGQLWGNPLYRWDSHISQNFSWWTQRFQHQFRMLDLVRIDHFRGFQACWSIPAKEKTAVNGHWESAPGEALFDQLARIHPAPPIVAEDLGVITPEVVALRERFSFPGMKILQFAFDSGPDNPYLPHNYNEQCLVYTGTHDNNTTLAWWHELSAVRQEQISAYLGKSFPEIPWDLIRLAMSSVAALCIIPCQDILGLGAESRFNRPGQATGNWRWRLQPEALNNQLAAKLLEITKMFNR
ncbi:MAG: 4-alpha-glucanotransferase [Deltaproteobacteria bacterium]|jgi:4-alpha-glucanotransferase|nr:4-alpha-glucanotransferase [Deltaproteobacteria bacterium]